jgi:hypothetical protein
MKAIIIKEENRARIEEAVEKANGRGKARLVSADDVFGITEYIIEKYGISKAAMNGCKWEIDLNAQHFPNAYKFQPLSTHIYIEFSNGTFKLTDVKRDYCWRSEKHYRAELTEAAKQAIIANLTTF